MARNSAPGASTRQAEQLPNGNYRLTIRPPAAYDVADATVELSAEEYERYCAWLKQGGLLQSYLPDLTDEQREILLLGMTPETYGQVFGGGPE